MPPLVVVTSPIHQLSGWSGVRHRWVLWAVRLACGDEQLTERHASTFERWRNPSRPATSRGPSLVCYRAHSPLWSGAVADFEIRPALALFRSLMEGFSMYVCAVLPTCWQSSASSSSRPGPLYSNAAAFHRISSHRASLRNLYSAKMLHLRSRIFAGASYVGWSYRYPFSL